jgi:SulP family sulfate permease
MSILPAVTWLRDYQRPWWRPDLLAALTLWALVVPQAIAYAQIAGLPPQSGLFATAAGLLAYALLGTSRQLVVSPTSSTAAISAALVAGIAVGDPARSAGLSALLAILVGLALIALGALKMGFVARFISAGVQTGFMTGLGLTIIVSQLPKILGVPGVSGTFAEQVAGLARQLGQVNGWTIGIGAASLLILLVLGRLTPAWPAALIVVVMTVLFIAYSGWTKHGVEVLGSVPGALPVPAIPHVSWRDILALAGGAIAIAVIGFAESTTVAEDMADRHHYTIKPNQELRAIGAGNVLAGFFQGFIVGGGASQTAANDRAGARTQMSGLIVCALTIATAGFLLPLFRDLPQAALGAIVITAVLAFVNIPAMRRLARLRRDSFVIALLTMAGVLFLGILPGLILSVVLSILLLLRWFARPLVTSVPGDGPGVRVMRLTAPLLFLNAKRIRDQAGLIMTADPRLRTLIIDLPGNAELDIESLDVLAKLERDCADRGITLRVTGLGPEPLRMLAKAGLTIGDSHD